MLPLRLVLDTNVVISGALKPQGLERATLTFSLTPPARLYVSPPIRAEYREVLARPELRIATAERKEPLGLIAGRARLIHPSCTLKSCTDPDDNIFLECADAARADYLLTGNKRHFPPYWKSTKIINPREVIAIVAPHLGP
jgi:putative PIN family toxin of toxin-antitoxin system